MPKVRVLLVDDYEPLRGFVRSMLQQDGLEVIGEASDGLEAVHKAEQLQPDLILLDIGLPKLNGLEAARRLRKLVPGAQIVFLSEESSADVVREAFGLGAEGYIHKLQTDSELLPAIETVLAGKLFFGGRLEDEFSRSTAAQLPPPDHELLIYSDDAVLLESLTRFVATALRAGRPTIVFATKSQLDGLLHSLNTEGLDVAAAVQEETFVPLDVTEMLATFEVNNLLDRVRCIKAANDLIQAAAKFAKGTRIAVCGAAAPLLWAEGKRDAAIWLERLWNDLAKVHGLDILCAYSSSSFHGGEDEHAFKSICAVHSQIYSR